MEPQKWYNPVDTVIHPAATAPVIALGVRQLPEAEKGLGQGSVVGAQALQNPLDGQLHVFRGHGKVQQREKEGERRNTQESAAVETEPRLQTAPSPQRHTHSVTTHRHQQHTWLP
jgi:hypothetical protein